MSDLLGGPVSFGMEPQERISEWEREGFPSYTAWMEDQLSDDKIEAALESRREYERALALKEELWFVRNRIGEFGGVMVSAAIGRGNVYHLEGINQAVWERWYPLPPEMYAIEPAA